ncbi:hypothetical protein [Pseudoalteromonas maricaloris]|uniref:hypothetical protein n=1 Tax=Pseudoalteromonas maricaloris TaxID=184924 RepID=UPI00058082F5|nr:hypothetical protein [Pseudoalteromonas flavipulchra]KID37630.1 hypothetical protein QT15_06200 [Pseudoalteromonas flavipulchra NCIMB 2033 = ATCC BAA-314]MBD0783822.1 hypothetical protein [Pseudoalteromonas flavipulchra]MBE0374398.1 hypothetical protein [Pseudoalteromonas flavipulchra NCIMB 2033 = ATCC BAA-314]
MDTIVCDWQIVTVKDNGQVLWGICVEDKSFRFGNGDYICTSKLVEIKPKKNLIKTASGSIYKVVGDGKKAIVELCDFELLRNGFNPQQIKALKTTSHRH